MKSLDLIAWAWPAEVALIVLYVLLVMPFMPPDRVELLFRSLPYLSGMIAGQGAAAYFGKAQPKE